MSGRIGKDLRERNKPMLYADCKRSNAVLKEDGFSLFFDRIGEIASSIRVESVTGFDGQDYPIAEYERTESVRKNGIAVRYSGLPCKRRDFVLTLTLTEDGAVILLNCDGGADFAVSGCLPLGGSEDAMAVRTDGRDDILRAAAGPASLPDCRGVFLPEKDAVLLLDSLGELRLFYDWNRHCFRFSWHTARRDYAKKLTLRLEEDFYRRRFRLDYRPLGPAGKKPLPVGWMTWYAVQFHACEETVLRNVRFQREHLAQWGANTVWVDWEWFHRDFTGLEKPGTDMFHPDAEAYPHGLKTLADAIREAGFAPALWIGPTCDAAFNEVLREHPDLLLAQKPSWCGQYFLDPSHPVFLNEVLPRTVRQVKEWGFEAVKWDVLPGTAQMCREHRERLYRSDLSVRQIMRNAFARARELLGPDTYMLYCSGGAEEQVDHAVGCFDAMRVGGDIFGWKDFISQCVDRVYDTYMLNGVAVFCDPDNVILREEFNTLAQARTRASFVSLLGLPFTMGDPLPELPEERLDILRRCIPPLPARPVGLRRLRRLSAQGILHIRVEKPFAAWDLVDAYNLSDGPSQVTLDFARDLMKAPDEAFHVYDYWRNEYLGVLSSRCTLNLDPWESRVLALHPVSDIPQVISASRHVSQGALEIEEITWDAESGRLSGRSRVPRGVPYTLTLAVPEPWRFPEGAEAAGPEVCRVTLLPEQEDFRWSFSFSRAVPGKISP